MLEKVNPQLKEVVAQCFQVGSIGEILTAIRNYIVENDEYVAPTAEFTSPAGSLERASAWGNGALVAGLESLVVLDQLTNALIDPVG